IGFNADVAKRVVGLVQTDGKGGTFVRLVSEDILRKHTSVGAFDQHSKALRCSSESSPAAEKNVSPHRRVEHATVRIGPLGKTVGILKEEVLFNDHSPLPTRDFTSGIETEATGVREDVPADRGIDHLSPGL